MAKTVRIMPKQPIEAVPPFHPAAWPEPVWIIKDADGDEAAVPQSKWSKVSDPITWDGTLETRHRLHLAIGHNWWLDPDPDTGTLYLTPKTDGGTHASITPGLRIQIVGDSFAILPPAKGGDA